MPIVTKRGDVMSSKYLFTLLQILILSVGCSLLDRSSPNVATTPPYWQPQGDHAQSQLNELRAFHDKESAKMSDDVHVFRNREMERLAHTGKELEIDQRGQDDHEKNMERREKWTSWFPKKNKKSENDEPLVSETSKTVR